MLLRRPPLCRVFRALGFFVGIACGLSLANMARAQGDDGARERSRAAFRRGVALVKEANYAGARDAFDEAYRIYSHPSILLNLGLARAKTGEYVEAEQNLAGFLVDDGGAAPDEQKSARAALADVRMHLGTLRVRVTPAAARATLDRKPIALVSGAVSSRVLAGDHALHVEADGYAPLDEVLRVDPGTSTSKAVMLSADRASGASGASGAAREDTISDLAAGDAAMAGTRTLGWSLVAAGAAALGFGTYTGLRALSLSKEYERSGVSGIKSTGVAYRTVADVSFLTGLASAGIGLYLLLRPAHPTKSARLVIGPAHTAIVGSF